MDRMNFVSGGLFLLSNVFSITSVTLPDWLISDIERSVSGPQKIGIFRSCIKVAGRNDFECYLSLNNVEWVLTLMCIVCAACSNFLATALFLCARWRPGYARTGRWFGVIAVIAFCLATIIFPAGFSRIDVGGAPYQLPSNCRIGIGYIFFMLALWVSVVAELINAKIFGSQ